MKFFTKMKDGGKDSTVTGYWLLEWKALLSICVLKFEGDSREVYHTHAFHCISWVLSGELKEEMLDGRVIKILPSIFPFLTTRKDFHKVSSVTDVTWLFTIRGPWAKTWEEYLPTSNKVITLTNGRKVIGEQLNGNSSRLNLGT